MSPATNVPWPYVSAQPASVEKLAQLSDTPFAGFTTGTMPPDRSGTSATPVSITATVMPWPTRLERRVASAPTTFRHGDGVVVVVEAPSGRTSPSGEMARTPGADARRPSAAV